MTLFGQVENVLGVGSQLVPVVVATCQFPVSGEVDENVRLWAKVASGFDPDIMVRYLPAEAPATTTFKRGPVAGESAPLAIGDHRKRRAQLVGWFFFLKQNGYIKDFIKEAAAKGADACFPEMYNVYRHQGVELMFHSFYNARHKGKTILDEIMPAEIRVRASDNLMWGVANTYLG